MGDVYTYMVVLSHGLDDMPMRLLYDRDEAFEYANSLHWMPSVDYLNRLELPDCSTPCVITVWTFRNGEPVSRVVVRNYDDEDDDESEVPIGPHEGNETA